jgi:uncharacterized protein YggT (Ycf19 family)
MTQREIYRETNDPNQREVYRETATAATSTTAPEDASRDIYREQVVTNGNDRVVRTEHVHVPSEATRRTATISRARQVIYFVFGAIESLLALRFLLMLLGANQGTPFVDFIYGLSRPFVYPFQGIFGEPALGASVIEWSSLVAIIVYMAIAYGLVRVLQLVYAKPNDGEIVRI